MTSLQPEEEARLAVISCAPLVSTKTEQLLVVDIGGGSTELVWIDLSSCAVAGPPARDHATSRRLQTGCESAVSGGASVVDWISVPLGVATLRDQFNDVERRFCPICPDELVFRRAAGRVFAL